MLSVVCWKWTPPIENYRSTFTPDVVNTLRSMVARHYPDPHRFICVTDDGAGLAPDIEVVPIWTDHWELPHPHSHTHPSCYRRLRAFSPDAARLFGPRFVSIDLDCVILDDLRPLWNRKEPFVGWGGTTQPRHAYNGSMYLLTAGARPRVWTEFHPVNAPRLAKQAGFYGSDQAWMSYVLGEQEPRWTTADGVYSYRIHVAPTPTRDVPQNARLVFFNGKKDPWSPDVRGLEWVRRHWR